MNFLLSTLLVGAAERAEAEKEKAKEAKAKEEKSTVTQTASEKPGGKQSSGEFAPVIDELMHQAL